MASAFEAFLSDVEALRRDAASEPELVKRLAARLQRLNREERWLPECYRETCNDEYKQHLVYVAPDGGFSVCSLVWCEDQATPIHDHVAWCVVGVYEGVERETRYRLMGSGEEQHLVVSSVRDVAAGGAAGYPADGRDIHKVANPTG